MRLFSSKAKQLIGVDLSSTSVKMVEVLRQQGVYHLKSYGIEPLAQGMIVDDAIVNSESVGEAVSQLARRLGLGKKQVATAVSGSAVITKIIEMDAVMTESEREAQIRLDADQYIPYPLAEVNLDFEILGPSEIDPNLVQVLLAASRSENVEQRVDALSFGGLDTKVMDIESHAMERAFDLMASSLPHQPDVVALVDIGHQQTTLYVVQNGEFVYSREQLFGGAQLTEAIQSRYGLTFEEATINKREQTLPDDYRSEVLTPFMDNLVQQVTRSLQFYFSSSQFNNVDHIVLSGGSAALPGLATLMQQKLGSYVSIANPFINMTVGSRVNSEQLAVDAPSLMVACGLALRSFD